MLTLSQAAALLGLSPSTLRHQASSGRLRAQLMGKTYVVTEREVERYRREQLGKPGRPSHRSTPPSKPHDLRPVRTTHTIVSTGSDRLRGSGSDHSGDITASHEPDDRAVDTRDAAHRRSPAPSLCLDA